MKDMMITFHIEGAETPVAIDVGKASDLAKELDRAGKQWRLGKTC
jgi:hypothetical protein